MIKARPTGHSKFAIKERVFMRILVIAGSGIGKALVKHDIQAGHEVWSGCRHLELNNHSASARLHLLEFDVCDPKMIEIVVADFQFGLDLIINNAGVAGEREHSFGCFH